MNAQGSVESRLQTALEGCIDAGAPGAILVIDAPRLSFSFSGAAGLFQRGAAQPLRPEDPFRIASVSKAVTAATAVRLAAEGRWDLEDSVASFLPDDLVRRLESLDGLPSLEALTVRRLLNHTSGLPDYFFDEEFQAGVQAEPDRNWRPQELAAAALKRGRLDFAPGTSFAYGDTGYVLVGVAIETVEGCPLSDVYRSLVFVPLGMDATYLEWHEPPRGLAVSHHYDGESDLTSVNTSFDWAGGGLVSTGGDLAKFLRGLFGEALLNERWLGELTSWRDELNWQADSSALYRRYGLGIGTNSACGEEIVGATGVWGAFAYFWPAGDAAITGTVNQRRFNRGGLLDEIVCALRRLY